jgi:hypothetical protein
MKNVLLFLLPALSILSGCNNKNQVSPYTPVIHGSIIVPALPFSPRHYVCYRTSGPMIIDGDISGNEWKNAPWSEAFNDIEGSLKPAPLQDTRMKVLWDDDYLYIAAEIKETDIQARLRQRDTIIFYDNDFEVFIDPDDDTHGYYEFEMNALNTVWDLLLTAPYRDYGNVLNAWDIKGLKSAVKIYGTINDPHDKDDKWTVELAFPMKVLKECGNTPEPGRQWRINFSRVEWKTKVENGRYVKETDPVTGRPYQEYNWVWSAQGLINMHYPELWGFLQFDGRQKGDPSSDFVFNNSEKTRWELRRLYYAERNFAAREKRYTSSIAELSKEGYRPENIIPDIILTMEGYEASLPDAAGSGKFIINTTGRVWKPE